MASQRASSCGHLDDEGVKGKFSLRAFRRISWSLGAGAGCTLVPHDLHEDASIARPIELDEEHALPPSELELAIDHRDGL